MGPDVSVETRQDATGRVYVEILSGNTDVSLTVANQTGQTGILTDASRLADDLERASRQLRRLVRPVDPGDHFIRPDERAAHEATEAAAWAGSFDVPLADAS